jgi:hypothetical protein
LKLRGRDDEEDPGAAEGRSWLPWGRDHAANDGPIGGEFKKDQKKPKRRKVMEKANMNNNQELDTAKRSELTRKLGAVGWGLFFIWMGVALFAHLGWGVGLLGVGIITLGAQAARKYFALKLEGFWIAVGFFFVAGGIWELFNVQLGLLPILCLVAGVALFVSILAGKPGDSLLCRNR